VDAGFLKHRVTIQAKSVTRNSFNEEIITYNDLATVWAGIKTKSGREFESADTTFSETIYEISLRYRTDISVLNRIKYLDRYFDIENVIDKDLKRQYLTLTCMEVK